MGQEARCTLTWAGETTEGKALLEGEEIIFRPAIKGGVRLTIRFADATAVAAESDAIRLVTPAGEARFAVGAVAAKWAEKIKHPKGRIEKLGIKAQQRVALISVDDATIVAELKAAGAIVEPAAEARDLDVVFYGARTLNDLAPARLRALEPRLTRTGALWLLRRKGKDGLPELAVLAAGKEAGYVDVKVVAFSPTHTGAKFVIPVARR